MKTLTGLFLISMLTVACSGAKNFDTSAHQASEDHESVQDSVQDSFEDTLTDDPELASSPELTSNPMDEFLMEAAATKDYIPLWEAKVKNSKEWSNYVYSKMDTLGKDLLAAAPADRWRFCPEYRRMSKTEKKQYWTFMLSAMARFESNFNTNAKYTEAFNDSKGNRVISRGLLQISIESGRAYGCDLKTTQDLHNPYKNLECGIRILNRWVKNDGRIAGKVGTKWRGGARYWAVLRSGEKTSYKSIVKWSKNLSICN